MKYLLVLYNTPFIGGLTVVSAAAVWLIARQDPVRAQEVPDEVVSYYETNIEFVNLVSYAFSTLTWVCLALPWVW